MGLRAALIKSLKTLIWNAAMDEQCIGWTGDGFIAPHHPVSGGRLFALGPQAGGQYDPSPKFGGSADVLEPGLSNFL